MSTDFDPQAILERAQQLLRDAHAGKVDLSAARRAHFLEVVARVCAHAQWTNRTVGWMFFGIGALFGVLFLLAGHFGGFLLGAIPAALAYLYVRRMKDGTRHAAYRLLRDEPETVRSMKRVSQTNGVEFIDLTTERRTVRIAANRANAPELEVAIKNALPQLATPAQAS